jgi:hypothetical protein
MIEIAHFLKLVLKLMNLPISQKIYSLFQPKIKGKRKLT